ncbi:MAG: hypothetical protein K2P17_01135 [Helicobacteraceae bacterium]|nr:hypothetical protein [Helicobacteraceae bacterium]
MNSKTIKWNLKSLKSINFRIESLVLKSSLYVTFKENKNKIQNNINKIKEKMFLNLFLL